MPDYPYATIHQMIHGDSTAMKEITDQSIDLVVTSPPYPMIQMWDAIFSAQDQEIGNLLERGYGLKAYERMHVILDKVWAECFRVMKSGAILCINIGDATRSIDGEFSLYPNHARILSSLTDLGFSILPEILWRKQTNAPNKFMGSGMLPGGAYVTLEHEFILVARKGGKREFKGVEKQNRQNSAYFWEERNTWFSDVWMDLKGARQEIGEKNLRERSAAFPFELPFRLINMYSAKGDAVLDPFGGLGTTILAAMACGRNSIAYEQDEELSRVFSPEASNFTGFANKRQEERLARHVDFVLKRFEDKGAFRHKNTCYGFPVITGQEKELVLDGLTSLKKTGNGCFSAEHGLLEATEEKQDWTRLFDGNKKTAPKPKRLEKSKKSKSPLVQTSLFD
ncbi:DNA-methyltransferase [Desulfatibacillum aliphaticivorans]|uniref:DNA-methyltransferase n=1 Tax=Desulfatibacillum aliphaticivorans TaxID=218208 RepID=UPI0003FF8C5B|nr:site-specific DNA-methyltransferase [Desulfatibacillum aliphaticivorans]